jgi:hypothetical protein
MEFFKKLEASKLRSVSRKTEFKLKLDKFRLPAKYMTQGVPHFRCKLGDV